MDLTSYLLGKKASGGGGGGGDLDWTAIGYSNTPQYFLDIYNEVNNDYNYSKTIYDNWDSTTTTMSRTYRGNKEIVVFPKIDTSNVTYVYQPLMSCSNLREIPILDFSKVTYLSGFAANNELLNDKTLDNILVMSINMSSYTGAKKLRDCWGLSLINIYTDARIQALPHYQAFINAGWIIS